MELFASPRSDAVTVAEIADAAGMTSAAVYYHFASKDDILLEGLRLVGDEMVAEARRAQQDIAARHASIGELPVRLLEWMERAARGGDGLVRQVRGCQPGGRAAAPRTAR